MNITDKIIFDEMLPFSQQSDEFKSWYNKNVNSQINENTEVKSIDAYNRPYLYSVMIDGFIVEIQPIYKADSQSDWGCSDFQITIKTA